MPVPLQKALQIKTGTTVSTLSSLAVSTAATGGTFSAGTYFWKITATNTNTVGATGETTGSNEVSLTIAPALTAPTGLAVAAVATGGTFAAATYYWKITGTNSFGQTTGSAEVSAAIALNGSANLTWAALPAGTTGVNVYRATTAASAYPTPALVATLGAVTAYTDTGAATTAGTVPTANTTADVRTAVLTWTAAAGATGYKVYRGTAAGAENALVATLGAVTTYTDTGTAGSAATVPTTNTAYTAVGTLDAQGAANVWAGTTGLQLLGALNVKNGTTGLGFVGVVTALNNSQSLNAETEPYR